MRRLLTDLRESAGFLADLFRTVLTETVGKAGMSPANGRTRPRDRIRPWTRPLIEVVDAPRTPRGLCWFR